ncbi:MAG: DUF305 domain-containing protein [Gemmatimonadaceae bacterium]|nr:DUF305 domain-containing protein [Gemmatimonadaceae bacterium]
MRLLQPIRLPLALTLAALAAAAACAPNSDERAATDSAAAQSRDTTMGMNSSKGAMRDSMGAMSSMSHDSMAGMNPGGMAPMGGMTGDSDRDFLRMMSDHHKGMIAMAHLTLEGSKKGSATVQADAAKLDKSQDAEVDTMVTLLEKQYKDAYDPKIMPDNQAMVDRLKSQSGAAYDRAFYQNVVLHHQQALKLIDQSLPKMKDSQIKAMAERMRREQAREISDFQEKAEKR